MSSRFLIVAPLAVIITAALFFLMRDLITTKPEKPDDVISEKVNLKPKLPQEKSDPIDRTPPPVIEEPKAQPATIDHTAIKIPTDTKLKNPGPFRPGPDGFGPPIVDLTPMSGGAGPIIRPKPQYPACGKGVGEVVLDYVVEPDGSVRDVKVVKATSSCFARAAERSTTRWKYRPEVADGKAVRSGRKRVTLQFVPEES